MTKDEIQSRIIQFSAQQEQFMGQINMITGRIAECKYQLELIENAEKTAAEAQQAASNPSSENPDQ